MSARENILADIKVNKPSLKELPVITLEQVTQYDNVVEKFSATLESIGGKIGAISNIDQLLMEVERERNEGKLVINAIDGSGAKAGKISSSQTAIMLAPIDKAYIKAGIGIAENGAVWISESQMINRLLPFICQHLVIVLEKDKIVSTMHHAYAAINSSEEGFGLFLAGPSKTADIEQSLVIGAHGARSLVVYLV